MGGLWSSVSDRMCWADTFAGSQKRVLLQGLDAAGKTTVLYRLKLGESVSTIPTIGFNTEDWAYKMVTFTAQDIGGREKSRPLWRHFYAGTDAIVFVVASNDRDRIDDSADYEHSAKDELNRLMADDELRHCPLLVYANKQDLPSAMGVQEVIERLGLNKLRQRMWHVQPCVATTGVGLTEGLDWLHGALKEVHNSPDGKTRRAAAAKTKAAEEIARRDEALAAAQRERAAEADTKARDPYGQQSGRDRALDALRAADAAAAAAAAAAPPRAQYAPAIAATAAPTVASAGAVAAGAAGRAAAVGGAPAAGAAAGAGAAVTAANGGGGAAEAMA